MFVLIWLTFSAIIFSDLIVSLLLAGSWVRGVFSPRTGRSRDGPAARIEKGGSCVPSSGCFCRHCLSGRQMTVVGQPGLYMMTGGGSGSPVMDRYGVRDGHLCGFMDMVSVING